jgi:16S rRNA (cytosine1402-N4)-methyltransferase
LLEPAADGTIVDCTLGFGGHSKALLDRYPNAKLIGIDQDGAAIEMAKERLKDHQGRIWFVHTNFSDIEKALRELDIESVAGILADLGVSSMQLDSETRGFSFRFDTPLDMRMDPSADVPTAAELLAELGEEEIANIIYNFGEERHSRRIARNIVKEREAGRPIETTRQLAELIRRSVRKTKHQSIDPATKTFQALRIKVNSELDILEQFLFESSNLLVAGGILAVITFHSLEDRIVKNSFQRLAGKCICPPRIPVCVCGAKKTVELVNRKPIVPSEADQFDNPRSRSAKLRAVRKLEE